MICPARQAQTLYKKGPRTVGTLPKSWKVTCSRTYRTCGILTILDSA
jgi:hypothetical protein